LITQEKRQTLRGSNDIQLGWHPEEPPSYAVNLKILLKKGKKYIQGTIPKPSKQERKGRKTMD